MAAPSAPGDLAASQEWVCLAAKSNLGDQDTHDSSTAPEIFFFSSSTSAFSSSRLDCASQLATRLQHSRTSSHHIVHQ